MSGKLLTPATDPTEVAIAALPSASASDLPPTRGNVTMLVDMEESFTSMYTALRGARNRVLICAWFLHLDTLINGGSQPPTLIDELRRLVNRGVEINLLLSFLEGQAFPGARPAPEIRTRLLKGLSKTQLRHLKVQIGFHPATVQHHRIGTYHEKLLIIDGVVAFCGGLEFNKEYGKAAMAGLHRHDVHSRIEGPAVSMLERHFVALWNTASKEAKKQKLDEEPITLWPADASPNQSAQAMQWVFTAGKDGTSALDPYHKGVTEVFDAYASAIEAAQSYIYIENQYFRSDELTQKLIARLRKNKQLELIVLVPNAPEESLKDPITRFSQWVENQQIHALTQENSSQKPRIGFFSLCQGRGRFPYVHSKIMLIDDKWLTVGTANINPRGFFLDMESNLLVRDDKVTQALRARLWKEHLGVDTSRWNPAAGGAIDFWLKAAASNTEAIRHGRRGASSVVEHKFDPKVTRPTDKELFDSLHVKEWQRPLVPLEKVLKEVVFDPEFGETRMA
jgi:phosphatidylserine/phosphatidylglycerophosphate/cardiolipin synthase-like enzyme